LHNNARATWFVQRVQEAGQTRLDVTLHNRKVNDGASGHPLGLHFEFGERTVITKGTAERAGFSSDRSVDTAVRARIIAELKASKRAMTYAELAGAIETSSATVRDKANAYAGRDFVILPPEPGERAKRVALLDPREPHV
jgi:hypothetical protein